MAVGSGNSVADWMITSVPPSFGVPMILEAVNPNLESETRGKHQMVLDGWGCGNHIEIKLPRQALLHDLGVQ